jgi:hypothetical protein
MSLGGKLAKARKMPEHNLLITLDFSKKGH